jgi:hypothetical protein
MQIQVDIGFEQLIEIVKHLPDAQLKKLKKEIENTSKPNASDADLRSFLMSGPVFSKSQLDTIDQTRKAIDQWRTK